MAHNITHEVKNNKLIITVDISPASLKSAPPSATGKTHLVASTAGTIAVVSTPHGSVSFSANVMLKRSDGAL